MSDQVVIEHLEFQGHCGVTVAERLIPQSIAVDIVLDYPPAGMAAAAEADTLTHAVDYAKVVDRVIETGTSQAFHLLETLTDRLLTMLLNEFPVSRVRLWVRKVGAPVKQVQGSVGVKVDRTRIPQIHDPQPARFLEEYGHLLPMGTALDVAAGAGRNTLYLASRGFAVHSIDRDGQSLATVAETARQREAGTVTTETIDLERDPHQPPDLGKEIYNVVLVFFYLYRPLFPVLVRALKPGGVLMYETFLIDNHLRHNHPRRREFCLAHNELLHLAKGLRVLRYEEGPQPDGQGEGSTFTARLIARKERLGGSD